METAPVEGLSHEELIAAQDLAELALNHRDETEADRRPPDVVIQALFDSGLLRLATAKRVE